MCLLARPAAPALECVTEEAVWCPASRRVAIFAGRRADALDLYAVAAFPADGGVGVWFEKRTPGTDLEESEGYTVFLADRPGPHGHGCDTCECRGFLRWGKPCKHVRAARALHAAGKLVGAHPPAEYPVEPAYSDAEIDALAEEYAARGAA